MLNDNSEFRLIPPEITPVLDPYFRPAVLANKEFRAKVETLKKPDRVRLAVEQEGGSVFQFNLSIFPADYPEASGNFRYVERFLKFVLWSRGGYRIYFAGPRQLGKQLQQYYSQTATGKFDADIMGNWIYEKPFEVMIVAPQEIPPAYEATKPLGRHMDGCRIGLDLGASDRKVAAVIEGKAVFSKEVVWNPATQSDPQWHFDQVMNSLEQASQHLPRIEAIGGSSAGVFVNNRVKIASLFRGIPKDLFNKRIKNIFLEIKKAMGNIPFEIVNDGEVAALAGSMSIGDNAVLGIALGSSQAAGYVTPEGNITSWLNELAFAPVDLSPQAHKDEWSGDTGCGVQYFSQQAVGRLLNTAGIPFDSKMSLYDRLESVQDLMGTGDFRAKKIFQTIGTYLGYAVAHYADFYEIRNILILGRVTSGPGGSVIIGGARAVLKREFPQLLEKIAFHIPSEKEKRHGQAVAAASLPVIPESR
jgi:predicted NBD/HSP70 family sugar kinase